MPGSRHARPGRAVFALSLGAFLLACDEPTTPHPTVGAAGRESSALLSRLAASGPALAEEADRLLPAVGHRFTEQPLRLALRTLRDRVTTDGTEESGRLAREAIGLVRSYRGDDNRVDPAELDAIQLLITSLDEVISADRAEAHRLEWRPL